MNNKYNYKSAISLCIMSFVAFAAAGQTIINVMPQQETPKQKITVEVEDALPVPQMQKIKTVLVVQNHTHPPKDIPMLSIADSLVTSMTGGRIGIVNPDNVIGINQNRTTGGEMMPETSAHNLARQLNAEAILTATAGDYSKIKVAGGKLQKLRVSVSLSLADLATDTVRCSAKVKVTGETKTEKYMTDNETSVWQDLLSSAFEACAEAFNRNMSSVARQVPDSIPSTTVFFGCNVLGADVQIDGVSYGTCPAQINIAPGIHNLLVSYPPYYLPFNRRANFTGNGQTFAVVLQITPEGEKVRRSGILFDRQKTLFDAELSRYKNAGEVEDYVRKTIADGTSIYWKNSYGRIVITDGTAENIEFTTPHADSADLQDAPTTAQIGKKLRELLVDPSDVN